MEVTTQKLFCSQQDDINLLGSAPECELWLMLEYSQAWGRKVLTDSNLSSPIKDLFDDFKRQFPHSKLLFIKQPERRSRESTRFYISLRRNDSNCLLKFDLNSYADLLELDLSGICENPEHYSAHYDESTLALVCTNGKRDQCCAKFGLPVYKTLQNRFGESVWQCSHFGGHVFAPTMMVLPQNLCFGKIPVAQSCDIVDKVARGTIDARYLRGECRYPKPIQAALQFLRKETQNHAIGSYRLLNVLENTVEKVVVEFQDCANKAQFTVSVAISTSDKERVSSCALIKMYHPREFSLTALEEKQSATKNANERKLLPV